MGGFFSVWADPENSISGGGVVDLFLSLSRSKKLCRWWGLGTYFSVWADPENSVREEELISQYGRIQTILSRVRGEGLISQYGPIQKIPSGLGVVTGIFKKTLVSWDSRPPSCPTPSDSAHVSCYNAEATSNQL